MTPASRIRRFWPLALAATLGASAQEFSLERAIACGDHAADVRMKVLAGEDVILLAISGPAGGRVQFHARHAGGADQWEVAAMATSAEPWYGSASAMHGNVVAIGSPGAASGGPFTGAVDIMQWNPDAMDDPLLPLERILLPDATSGDRFGYALLWVGDTLAVGAVGRSGPLRTGQVSLFRPTGGGYLLLGHLPLAASHVQAPFVRWFGSTLAQQGDRLYVAAPFTGFRQDEPGQNIGSLHRYVRAPLSPLGWAFDGAWMDAASDGCGMARIELGRTALMGAGAALLVDHSAQYAGEEGSALSPWQQYPSPAQEGCATCGLRSLTWDEEGVNALEAALVKPSTDALLPVSGSVHGLEDLAINWWMPAGGAWVTCIHRFDEDAGVWTIAEQLSATDDCDLMDQPMARYNDLLARVVVHTGADCSVPDGMVRTFLQVYRH